ncbi:MAG: hypothetical protein ACREBW_05855, partial [Candidatus Micrarchaeaceae archaeon]
LVGGKVVLAIIATLRHVISNSGDDHTSECRHPHLSHSSDLLLSAFTASVHISPLIAGTTMEGTEAAGKAFLDANFTRSLMKLFRVERVTSMPDFEALRHKELGAPAMDRRSWPFEKSQISDVIR